MKDFTGFPSGGRVAYTAIPNVFFSGLLPQIADIAELKTTLHVMAALYRKKGYPRYLTRAGLLGDVSLMASLRGSEEALDKALEMAVARGTLLHLALDGDGAPEDIYLLNTESDRLAVAKIRSGEIRLSGLTVKAPVPAPAEPPPDIFTLYEQNIGMLTPMIADELRDAEKLYPPDWIRDAIKEAVLHNKRNIRYITKILENWSVEGRGDGTYQRHIKKADPNKYLKGKYGHMVRH
jgi:DnaD/phage-associated family protein